MCVQGGTSVSSEYLLLSLSYTNYSQTIRKSDVSNTQSHIRSIVSFLIYLTKNDYCLIERMDVWTFVCSELSDKIQIVVDECVKRFVYKISKW